MTSSADLSASPTRTCVGCRTAAPQNQLLRVVLIADAVVPDLQLRQPGRGAYLHRSAACIDRAIQRRSLNRALQAQSQLNYDQLLALTSSFISPQA